MTIRKITLINYIAPATGEMACAVHNPQYHWQNFAPRFANGRDCVILGQTPQERLSECIKTRYPEAEITVINT